MTNLAELQSELSQFTGTENYYRYGVATVLTDGVKFLADKAQCYWLLDIVNSVQYKKELRENREFQVFELTAKNDKAQVKVTDGNNNVLYRQNIPFTDFPTGQIRLFVSLSEILNSKSEVEQVQVIMLPNEY